MRISYWSSDVCSSDLGGELADVVIRRLFGGLAAGQKLSRRYVHESDRLLVKGSLRSEDSGRFPRLDVERIDERAIPFGRGPLRREEYRPIGRAAGRERV